MRIIKIIPFRCLATHTHTHAQMKDMHACLDITCTHIHIHWWRRWRQWRQRQQRRFDDNNTWSKDLMAFSFLCHFAIFFLYFRSFIRTVSMSSFQVIWVELLCWSNRHQQHPNLLTLFASSCMSLWRSALPPFSNARLRIHFHIFTLVLTYFNTYIFLFTFIFYFNFNDNVKYSFGCRLSLLRWREVQGMPKTHEPMHQWMSMRANNFYSL